ncbi:UNVERIFIED_CONTAM: hypothetical protein LK11_26170 [Mumia flava]
MLGLIYIGAVMGLFGVQINVVLTKRLYPRALLTPFTDNVQLTRADRRAYSDYAKAQRHKGFEAIRVEFVKDDEGAQAPASPAVAGLGEGPAGGRGDAANGAPVVRPGRTDGREQPEPQGS